jgi:hypothetical protein
MPPAELEFIYAAAFCKSGVGTRQKAAACNVWVDHPGKLENRSVSDNLYMLKNRFSRAGISFGKD